MVAVTSQPGDVLATDTLCEGVHTAMVGRIASEFGCGRYIAVGAWSSWWYMTCREAGGSTTLGKHGEEYL